MPARPSPGAPVRYPIRMLDGGRALQLAEPVAAYRPGQPEATALYRLVEANLEGYLAAHEERFAERDRPLGSHVRICLERYLECGRLMGGFGRIRCGDCGTERLLAFSCQTRNLCPSCQGKRSALLGEKLAEEIPAPVPHTHVVFTIPRASSPRASSSVTGSS